MAREAWRARTNAPTDPNRPGGAFAHPAQPDPEQREPSQKSKAGREHTTRRRGLLTGTIAALLTGTAAVATAKAASAPPAGDDAELLTLAQDFWRQDAIVAEWNADQVTEEIGEAAHDRWCECLDRISAILPTTDFGLRPKADCLLRGLEVVDTSSGTAEDFVRDFLADMAGREAA